MPTYEYRCVNGHAFDRIQKMSEAPLEICEVCSAAAVRSISGGAGLIFKGTGFYITDYGKDGKGARKDADGSASADAKSESKSETKPDAKSEAKSDAASSPKVESKSTESKPAPKADTT